jgi:hypothetical protein
MDTLPKIERDDFDRLISWALATITHDAQPSEQVWDRIVHHIANSERANNHTRYRWNDLPEWPGQSYRDLHLLRLQRG